MNLLVGFRAVIAAPPPQNAVLRVAASTLYRARVNGQFLGHGPARGPHGYYRVDEWDLSGKLAAGQNVVAIEVAGYNCNSYYLLDQPSFLQAEIVAGGQGAGLDRRRGRAVHRGRRWSTASRRSNATASSGRSSKSTGCSRTATAGCENRRPAWPVVECQVQPEKKLLPRHVLAPEFAVIPPVRHVAQGRIGTARDRAQLVERPFAGQRRAAS